MFYEKTKTRRKISIALKHNIKTKSETNLKKNLIILKKEIDNLLVSPELANQPKFLRRIALSILEIAYCAKQAKTFKDQAVNAEQIEHFLTTPLGAPFVAKTTLATAALNFSEQDPLTSDLHEILREIAAYGPKFTLQLLRIFSLNDTIHAIH
ncbi:MAG: hypothetical protein K2X08_00785 [Chlamydiales bacterium]|nr:hypothetical protein [Chlamydiales bacterium]